MGSGTGKPFFCYLPLNAPHTPLDVPDSYLKRFQESDLTERVARVYAMIANIDDNVGRLLNYLEKSNQLKNTIVIYMSDNGPVTVSRKKPSSQWRYNAGLRDQKFTVYEGGIRTHFFISWPGRFKETSVKTVAAQIDILPTPLDLCEVPLTGKIKMDGRSLKPLLTSANAPWQDRIIFLKYSWKTLEEPAPYPGGIARNQRYKMVDGKELYDLENDPGEKILLPKNLISFLL